MAKYRKKPVVVQAEPYRQGLEDGWEYEDQLPVDITPAMFAASKVDIVRLYPFIRTLEGPYFIGAGDWIVTGPAGERWPVSDEKFRAIYAPEHAFAFGNAFTGRYRSRPLERDAIRMPNDFAIFCSQGTLAGKAGDYLVLATPDDAYPVAAEVFAASYEAVEDSDATA